MMNDNNQSSSTIQKPATKSTTQVITDDSKPKEQTQVLKLRNPSTEKQIKWTADTIDNEKCCIFHKPRVFGESSSESSCDSSGNEDDNQYGHKKKKKTKDHKCQDNKDDAKKDNAKKDENQTNKNENTQKS